MVRIRQRQDRHFMDDEGRMFWINGPEEFCYLSEQRQWRAGLSFQQVLEWKQCAPSTKIFLMRWNGVEVMYWTAP